MFEPQPQNDPWNPLFFFTSTWLNKICNSKPWNPKKGYLGLQLRERARECLGGESRVCLPQASPVRNHGSEGGFRKERRCLGSFMLWRLKQSNRSGRARGCAGKSTTISSDVPAIPGELYSTRRPRPRKPNPRGYLCPFPWPKRARWPLPILMRRGDARIPSFSQQKKASDAEPVPTVRGQCEQGHSSRALSKPLCHLDGHAVSDVALHTPTDGHIGRAGQGHISIFPLMGRGTLLFLIRHSLQFWVKCTCVCECDGVSDYMFGNLFLLLFINKK